MLRTLDPTMMNLVSTSRTKNQAQETNLSSTESAFRQALGIPQDAQKVLLFTESSHWDPNWMLTSKGYFHLRVKRNLDQAIRELLREPRRVYSCECAFFVKMYWDNDSSCQDSVRDLLNSRRLRLMGSGVTTPDTIIPSEEALIRDYLIGQQWYLENGIDVEPDLAYFPDSFGHTPGMPALLRSLGIANVAICRIDGQYFLGCETESPKKYPKPNTSAELLSKFEKTQDFQWVSSDGSKIQAHWVAYGYGQGELLAHSGFTRVAGAPLAVPNRAGSHVAMRIGKYVKQLSKHAKTPYLLCPIGFDFSAPIPGLVGLLDDYNETYYPDSGVWALNAGLDDYFKLVSYHADKLPSLALDPNPYFSGFYTSRPSIKTRSRQLVDNLIATETRGVLDELAKVGPPDTSKTINDQLASAWWIAATSNHHDFITGTSPDRVVRKEQRPWLSRANDLTNSLGQQFSKSIAEAHLQSTKSQGQEVVVKRDGSKLKLTVPTLGTAVFDESRGGCLVSLSSPSSKNLLADFPSFDVVSYLDHGGLWRMGNEYSGGRFTRLSRVSDSEVALEVVDNKDGVIHLVATSKFGERKLIRHFWLGASYEDVEIPYIRFRCEYTIPNSHTISCMVGLPETYTSFEMDCPGDVISRSPMNHFDPTFWPVQSFADFRVAQQEGVSLFLERPLAVSLHCPTSGSRFAKKLLENTSAGSIVETILMRNAPKERYLGALPIPGFPARGHDPGPHSIDLALGFSNGGTWKSNQLFRVPMQIWQDNYSDNSSLVVSSYQILQSAIEIESPMIVPLAMKHAHRGEGIIIRLRSYAQEKVSTQLSLRSAKISKAVLCDGRERDLIALSVVDGRVQLECDSAITTVRISTEAT